MTQTRKGKQEQTSQTKQALHVLFDTQTSPNFRQEKSTYKQ